MIIALPTADRRAAHAFYRDGMGFEPFGEPAEDGVPEPLLFRLGGDLSLMLIPTGGFGWVTGGRPTADRGTSECLLSLPVGGGSAEVDALVARAVAAGAEVVMPPAQQPWGYTAAVADPDGHVWQVTT